MDEAEIEDRLDEVRTFSRWIETHGPGGFCRFSNLLTVSDLTTSFTKNIA
jgi:hypothetical protein